MRERQRRMFRIALDPVRYGLTLKVIEIDSGLGYDSLRNYASGETVMPITAVDALTDVIPDELLSLLFSGGRALVRIPEDIDHDEIAEWAETYSTKKLQAHRKDSECEEALGPNETADLNATVVQFPGAVAA